MGSATKVGGICAMILNFFLQGPRGTKGMTGAPGKPGIPVRFLF